MNPILQRKDRNIQQMLKTVVYRENHTDKFDHVYSPNVIKEIASRFKQILNGPFFLL